MPAFLYRLRKKWLAFYDRLRFTGRKTAFGRLILAIAIVFIELSAIRAETLPIKTYTSADGLIYEGVRRAYQDSRGFIWFCSPVGVSRFDGYGFTNYGMEDGLKPDPTISDIVEGENGIYWLGTNNVGVYRFDPRAANENKFTLYKISDRNKSANEVNLLDAASGQIIWKKEQESDSETALRLLGPGAALLEKDKNLFELSLANGKLTKIPNLEGSIFVLSPDRKKLAYFSGDRIFISGTNGKGQRPVFDLPEDWRTLRRYSGTDEGQIGWSPDGSRLIVFDGRRILIIRL